MSNVIQFPLFPESPGSDPAAVRGGSVSGGQCLVTLSKAAPRCQQTDQYNPFNYWVEGTPDTGFTGGVFVEETGEILTRMRERWNSRSHLESTLEDVACKEYALLLKSRGQHAPAWLVRKLGFTRWTMQSATRFQKLTDSMKAIRLFGPAQHD